MHGQTVAVFGGAAQLVDVGDVQLGVDAVHEQVHRQRHDVDVAGAFAVAEERALHPIGARHHAELGGRDGAPPVVVRVQRDDHRVALLDRAAEPLDHVAVHVGGVALDRRRQVEHDRVVGRRLHHVHHRFAHLDGELGLGQCEALRRVLVADLRVARRVLELAAQLRSVDRDVDDPLLVEPEHHLALEWVGRVVEVHDRPRRALQALVGALDQFLAALHQHLDRHVVGDPVLLDQLAHEVEVRLARRRESDLDLLETHRHEFLEHPHLARRVHRVDQRLIAVAQVDGAPLGCPVDRDVRPRAVGEHHRDERCVLLEGHLLRGDVLGRHRVLLVTGVGSGRGVGCWCRVVVRCRGDGRGGIWPEKQEPPGRWGGGCGRTWVCGARPTEAEGGRCATSASRLARPSASRSSRPRRYAGAQHD